MSNLPIKECKCGKKMTGRAADYKTPDGTTVSAIYECAGSTPDPPVAGDTKIRAHHPNPIIYEGTLNGQKITAPGGESVPDLNLRPQT